jgi:hypothetical protein
MKHATDDTKSITAAPATEVIAKSAVNHNTVDINAWRQQMKAGFAAIKADFAKRASPNRLYWLPSGLSNRSTMTAA